MIPNKAWWGDQMVAHKASFFSGLYKAHSVRSDSIHPEYQGFETAWSVRPYLLLSKSLAQEVGRLGCGGTL